MDFVHVTDLGRDGLAAVLDRAAAVKADPSPSMGTRAGLKVGLVIEINQYARWGQFIGWFHSVRVLVRETSATF